MAVCMGKFVTAIDHVDSVISRELWPSAEGYISYRNSRAAHFKGGRNRTLYRPRNKDPDTLHCYSKSGG